MGLDISAFECAELTDPHEREDEDGRYCGEDKAYGGQNHVFAYLDDGFEHALGGLIRNRCYAVSGESQSFRAGSYGGYNEWRAALSRAALGVEPETIWQDNFRDWEGKPFAELINFSDCEGVIGPDVCAKLARDFREQREKVRPQLVEWARPLYDTWQSAFELAAGTGLVQFH